METVLTVKDALESQKLPIQKIIWDDAGSFGHDQEEVWFTKEEIVNMYRLAEFHVVSVGMVVHEDEDSVIMAQSSEDYYDQFGGPFRIPKQMILKRINLDE